MFLFFILVLIVSCHRCQASTVSESDCLVRQGKWWGDYPAPLQNTPGVDVVGKVYHIKGTSESLYDLHPRQTVVSLVRWGGNSRYMTIHPNQVVKVPDGLDPAQVACLPETYLTAFQGLHMGQALNRRYRENSLKGKSVLIVGCMTNNMGKAIIELALNAGVANLYATAKRKHWNTLISFGVMPLGQDPMEWVKRLEGTIDIVLAPNGSQREDITPIHFRALVPKQGQLILCGHRTVGNDMPIKDWKRDQATLVCSKNKAMSKILMKSYAYDVYEEWQGNLELCKRDLLHLLELLERGVLKPEILDRLPLTKVGKAQELLESTRLPGFLVCEPWMRSKKRAVYL
jgi:NADPH:quinone reductase-like Zn-dependent oxidoreductase